MISLRPPWRCHHIGMRMVPVSISGPRALGGQSADGIVARLTVQRRWTAIAATYLGLGVEHILLGIGYLLFLVAMLLLVRSWHRLVATITAFTVAHSITLARPRLHSRAAEPVDEAIALSIVFVAAEIVRGPAGRPGLTERWPWIVAFVFGLLHGLGSASALREVGLPENATPASLLCFNLGLELGQIAFVGVVLALLASLRPRS